MKYLNWISTFGFDTDEKFLNGLPSSENPSQKSLVWPKNREMVKYLHNFGKFDFSNYDYQEILVDWYDPLNRLLVF